MHKLAKVRKRTIYHVEWSKELGCYVTKVGGMITYVHTTGFLNDPPLTQLAAFRHARREAKSFWRHERVPTQVYVKTKRSNRLMLEASYGCNSKARG